MQAWEPIGHNGWFRLFGAIAIDGILQRGAVGIATVHQLEADASRVDEGS